MDSRALCLAAGRLFLFRPGAFLACLDARDGRELWRKTKANAPELVEAFGPTLNRQDWRTNWRTTTYLKCSDQALYFSGPTFSKLLALSALDGRILWQHPYSNYQLVLLEDGLYALSGQIDNEASRKFDPLTGRVLEEVKLGRRACARPTGALDAVFCRASGGSTRWDAATDQPQLISPMRAQCQDGVTIANGLLYWWPSVCDCNLTLYGITCLGPAGDFDFAQTGSDASRLETAGPDAPPVAELPESPTDWPTFRADNAASATTDAAVPARVQRLWQYPAPTEITPTAPAAAGGLVFLAGSDGIVRALDARTGQEAWRAYTGGNVRFPPTLWNGRAFVGSGDGFVYAFEARSGRTLWRFRAAPVERRMPVYGQLLSTWPVAGGVLVKDGVAYAAAGIVNYDGTHVYALDAATGRIRWQNNNSGHLDPAAVAGVSVQGNMILHEDKLWLAGGNVVSPGVYALGDGTCLNDVSQVHQVTDNQVPASQSPRGSALYVVANQVRVGGQPHYAHPQYRVCDPSVTDWTWVASRDDRDYLWVNNPQISKILCYPRVEAQRAERLLQGWGKPQLRGLKAVWGSGRQGQHRGGAVPERARRHARCGVGRAELAGRPSLVGAPPARRGRSLGSRGRCGRPGHSRAPGRAGRVLRQQRMDGLSMSGLRQIPAWRRQGGAGGRCTVLVLMLALTCWLPPATLLACRYNVRDVGFVDLETESYRLCIFVPPGTPAPSLALLQRMPPWPCATATSTSSS
ncbi:MAG: PQQ-binding-like beta-propeller repeat protein [Verrucomicrobia bacterium]|nr:PQQ-binding-like beta-propeller repeat protein [Verrucomicrobiota bacterium]